MSAAAAPRSSTREIIALHGEGRHEEALHAIAHTLPVGPPNATAEAVHATAAAVRLLNELALGCMQRDTPCFSFAAAFAYLRRAQQLPTTPALKAVTLNNLSIYYSRTRQPHGALRCLQRVLKSEQAAAAGPGSEIDDVSVHVSLNLTTVLADLGRHKEALLTAQQAVKVLALREKTAATRPDPSLYSAAYHNLAVQQERLGLGNSGAGFVRSYKTAIAEAKRGGAASSAMVDFVEKAYSQARVRAQTRAQSATAKRPSSPLPPLSTSPSEPPEPPASRPRPRPASSQPRVVSAVSAERVYTVEQLYAGQASPSASASAAKLLAARTAGRGGRGGRGGHGAGGRASGPPLPGGPGPTRSKSRGGGRGMGSPQTSSPVTGAGSLTASLAPPRPASAAHRPASAAHRPAPAAGAAAAVRRAPSKRSQQRGGRDTEARVTLRFPGDDTAVRVHIGC